MQELHSGLAHLTVSAARRKAHISGGEDRKDRTMLDFQTTHHPAAIRQPVPGLDYYAPETLRPAQPAAAEGADPVRAELAALALMYGYWTQD